MSAAAPNPNNLLMLAVIGIGAYWLMTQRAVAQQRYATMPAASQSNTAALINAGGSLLSKLIGSGTASRSTYNPVNWASTDGRYNDMPVYSDGVAANNPYASTYDWWTANGSGGD